MSTTDDACEYEILVEGQIDRLWFIWFEGLALENLPGRIVRMTGPLPDQPALHGLIERIRDLNLVLVSVRRLTPEE